MRHSLRTILFSMTVLILAAASAPAPAQEGMLSAEGGKGEMPGASPATPLPAAAAPALSPPQQIQKGVQVQMDRMTDTMKGLIKPAAPQAAAAQTASTQTTTQTATQTTTQTTVQATTQTAQTTGASSPLSPHNPAYIIPGPPSKKDEKAQDDEDPLKNPIFRSLSSDMQDQIMAEAQTYNRDCKVNSSYAKFHDCDCLSVHFMNQRIRHPDLSQSKIQQNIQLDCVDVPSIAGYSYNSCIRLYSRSYPRIIQPLCECYARDFANGYAKAPNVTTQYQTDLSVRTLRNCRTKLTSMTPDGKAGASSMPPAR